MQTIGTIWLKEKTRIESTVEEAPVDDPAKAIMAEEDLPSIPPHAALAALSINTSTGVQNNHHQIGGSNNRQYNAETIHYNEITARPETPPNPSSTILPGSDPNFIDREELLERIRQRHSAHGVCLALVGLGGVGKTQIAIRYAQRLRAEDPSLWILWIFASNTSRFDESIREVADQIRLPGRQDPKANFLQLIHNWLGDSRRRWMVVLDNADDANFLLDPPDAVDVTRATKRRIDYFPTCDYGSVLLTSRDKTEAYKFVSEDNVVEVLPMDIQHARMLLRKKLGSLYSESSCSQLAKALDFMPLALSQAASFIRQKRRYTVEAYLAELEKSRKARTSLLRQHGTVPKRDRDASSSIILTWQISFEHIHSIQRSAADLLALMSFCDRQAIPDFLVRGVYKRPGGSIADVAKDDKDEADKDDDKDEETGFDNDIQMLEDFSFVFISTDSAAWDMHRLVQDATQWWLLNRGVVKAAQHRFIRHLYNVTPTGVYENWQTCRVLMPHVKSALTLDVSERNTSLLWADIMYKAAWFAGSQGWYSDAQGMSERSLHIRASLLGSEHLDTLSSMASLASRYRSQGRWADAEQLDVEVMETRKTKLGLDHPDTLTSMANLASTYRKQGRWADAEQLEVEVLKTSKTKLGLDHPDTLTSMANLASTYRKQGRWADAEQLEVEVIATSKTKLGLDHPNTLTSMANLAFTLKDSGRASEATKLMQEAAAKSSIKLGKDHPDTIMCFSQLHIWKNVCEVCEET